MKKNYVESKVEMQAISNYEAEKKAVIEAEKRREILRKHRTKALSYNPFANFRFDKKLGKVVATA